MPIRAEWDNDDKTIVVWTFEGHWTWDDYRNTQLESIAMMNTVEHAVDVIADVTHANLLPSNAFSNYKRLAALAAPNRRRVVVITGNFFMKTMTETYNKLFGETAFIFANSLDEAREILARDS
jgi:hypothetical protein